MGTFYLGLSMAGTVSAGTYTGGTLSEINTWLSEWQQARAKGIVLKVQKETENYKIGDVITLEPKDVPNHSVKIKSITGASGGGVSAALLLTGLSCGKAEKFLREVWTLIDVREMLSTDDLSKNRSIYSLLNVKPIDQLMEKLLKEKWNDTDYAKSLDYLDDNIEVFLTLASYEGIPYNVNPSNGDKVSYGIHKTHLDYIKFNFSKNGNPAPSKPTLPFAYNLVFNKNNKFEDDNNWKQLIESSPATAAFPIGFKPRYLKRFRKEYTGKLFYLNYTNPSDKVDYSLLQPAWPEPTGNDDPFIMEYVDGGTFNREPHDLARASIIESLEFSKKKIPNKGNDTNACVILIDPFATNSTPQKAPGTVVDGIPTLFEQPQYLIGAMMDQGRFRPDWIEKALDKEYYSRYLISPIRRDDNNNIQEPPLAASLLGAFSGFIDISFREHDYKLGHYNTYQFLNKYFAIPVDNVEIDYYRNASSDLQEKYEALGWFIPRTKPDENDHCQIIPRMIEPPLDNSLQQPNWPTITEDKWHEIYDLALQRAKALEDASTDFGWLGDKPIDLLIWQFLRGKVEKMLDGIEKELKDKGLLRKRS